MYYAKEEIEKVKAIDLYTYLSNYNPSELVHISRDTYCTKTHDSLIISNGFWNWFSKGIGGRSALDYLMKVNGLNFIEAMKQLSECTQSISTEVVSNHINKKNSKFIAPLKNSDYRIAKKYLLMRGIDEGIVQECIDNGLIYQEKDTKNIVFLGLDRDNTPRYAFVRSTGKNRFMHEAIGSHKAFSFKMDSLNKSDTLHVFESAIDLLSYATLLKISHIDWYKENLLSLAGIYRPARERSESKIPIGLNYYLNQNPHIKKLVLHLDNDFPGRQSSLVLREKLEYKYKVIDDPPKSGKDFNDFLLFIKGNISTKKELNTKLER